MSSTRRKTLPAFPCFSRVLSPQTATIAGWARSPWTAHKISRLPTASLARACTRRSATRVACRPTRWARWKARLRSSLARAHRASPPIAGVTTPVWRSTARTVAPSGTRTNTIWLPPSSTGALASRLSSSPPAAAQRLTSPCRPHRHRNRWSKARAPLTPRQ